MKLFGRRPDGSYKHFDLSSVDIKRYHQIEGLQEFESIPVPTRVEALKYVSFARCIMLLCTQAAEVITSSVRVIDENNKVVNRPSINRILDLIRETPDDFQSADFFIRSIMSDLLVDGNALIHYEEGNRKVLTRLDAINANTELGEKDLGLKGIVYRAQPFGIDGDIDVYPARTIAHARLIPQSSDYNVSGERQFFSESPLSLLRRALFIGKAADAWVGSFFDDAAKNNVAIMLPETMDEDTQKRQKQAFELTLTNKRAPLVLFGGATVEVINSSPQDADALALREFSVQEIGRFYGVPAPILGVNVTAWGSGIEHLARLYFRYGTRTHISVLLDALSFRMLPKGMKFDIDSSQEVKGDTNALSTFVAAVRPSTNNPGLMSREELRDYLGIPGDYKDDWGFETAMEGSEESEDGGRQTDDNLIPLEGKVPHGRDVQ